MICATGWPGTLSVARCPLPVFFLFIVVVYQSRGRLVGLYTVLPLLIMYGVSHPNEGPEGGRVSGSNRALV